MTQDKYSLHSLPFLVPLSVYEKTAGRIDDYQILAKYRLITLRPNSSRKFELFLFRMFVITNIGILRVPTASFLPRREFTFFLKSGISFSLADIFERCLWFRVTKVDMMTISTVCHLVTFNIQCAYLVSCVIR